MKISSIFGNKKIKLTTSRSKHFLIVTCTSTFAKILEPT
jgi:hypothetical protein